MDGGFLRAASPPGILARIFSGPRWNPGPEEDEVHFQPESGGKAQGGGCGGIAASEEEPFVLDDNGAQWYEVCW